MLGREEGAAHLPDLDVVLVPHDDEASIAISVIVD